MRHGLCVLLTTLAALSCCCKVTTKPTPTPAREAQGRVTAAGKPPAPASQPASAPAAKVPTWDLEAARNLKRLGTLSERQRRLLTENGFFLAPTPPTRSRGRGINRATHLFHVYERNDYIAFPSLVTADLAIDTTHAYFDAVLRDVEQRQLYPRLRRGLRALLKEAVAVHGAATTGPGKQAARRAVVYWGVALQLLLAPKKGDAPDSEAKENVMERETGEARPKPRRVHRPRRAREVPTVLRAEVEQAVQAIQAGAGRLAPTVLRADVDLTQMMPRGHYNRTGVLQRFFRCMSWLGMASFHVKGEQADLPGLVLMTRTWLGAKQGRTALARVLEVTSFFAGGADAADLDAAGKIVLGVLPDGASASADRLAAPETIKRLAPALARLPAPRIRLSATSSAQVAPPQVRVMGRRAFEDTVAMQEILKPLMTMVEQGREARILPPAMGALGSAAVLGSEAARREVLAAASPGKRATLDAGITAGRRLVQRVPAGRWDDDAYHGTLHALRPLLGSPPEQAPALLRTAAWRLRQLQAFAAGWAELRHDTILYGEQLGAECDAPEPPPPPGWVEPLPAVYGRLERMVQELSRRLKRAGIAGKRADDTNPYYRPLAEKAGMLVDLLRFLRRAAEHELAGKPLTRKQREQITLIGGTVEWIMITLADTDLLKPRDQDMAVVADVFTWRPTRQVVEVAVGHPDLIYAIIPGPRGRPVVARGAVMSYRAFLHGQDRRMTDESWRALLKKGKGVPGRPRWLDAIYAEPLPAIRLRGKGVDRCQTRSGINIEL